MLQTSRRGDTWWAVKERDRLAVGGAQSFVAAAVLVGAGGIALVVLGIAGVMPRWTLALVAVMGAGGAAAISGWRRASRVATQVTAAADAEQGQLEEVLDRQNEELAQQQ